LLDLLDLKLELVVAELLLVLAQIGFESEV
jgi:hypothetical protein